MFLLRVWLVFWKGIVEGINLPATYIYVDQPLKGGHIHAPSAGIDHLAGQRDVGKAWALPETERRVFFDQRLESGETFCHPVQVPILDYVLSVTQFAQAGKNTQVG